MTAAFKTLGSTLSCLLISQTSLTLCRFGQWTAQRTIPRPAEPLVAILLQIIISHEADEKHLDTLFDQIQSVATSSASVPNPFHLMS